jgi:hypothetical protein
MAHIDQSVLEEYASGRLMDKELVTLIEKHVLICHSCCSKVDDEIRRLEELELAKRMIQEFESDEES